MGRLKKFEQIVKGMVEVIPYLLIIFISLEPKRYFVANADNVYYCFVHFTVFFSVRNSRW